MSTLDLEITRPQDGVPFRASRNHIHATWARTYTSLPELYIQPASADELRKVLRLARTYLRRVVVVGSAHSPSALTLTSHWMINLDRMNHILRTSHEDLLVTAEAGIRLRDLSNHLAGENLALRNLGSIEDQSIAGAISTGTHGSSLRHGLTSENVRELKIMLADGSVRTCSADKEPDLFRAALINLGAMGVIIEMTLSVRPAFAVRWTQTIDADAWLLQSWSYGWWNASEFKRVWWFPYTRRAVVWSGDEFSGALVRRPYNFYDQWFGYHIYHNLLYLSQWAPGILPWVEWFVFGMQYGFRNGSSVTAVEPSREALLMNCLYSQFVNEWAIPLEKGPEALRRLSSWLNHLGPDDLEYMDPKIPFSSKGLYVHAPVEVRVSDTTAKDPESNLRPFLDPTPKGPTLYLNATLYRPYYSDPPCRQRYYEGFEYLMKDLGGRPHWAKNFQVGKEELEEMYGKGRGDLEMWRSVRDEVDPDGMFVGPWHRETILAGERLSLEEVDG